MATPPPTHTRSLIGEERYRLLANIDYTNDPEDQRKDYLQEVLQEIDREIRQRLDLVSQPVSQERPLHLPYLVVVVDSYEECGAALGPIQTILKSGSAIGASAMCLVRHMREVPGDCGAYLDLQANPMLLAIAGINGGRIFFQPDQIDSEKSRRMALAMSNIQLGDVRAVQNLPRTVNLLDLLGIADPRSYDCRRYWALQPPNDDTHPSGLFPVPIGSSGPDMPLMLDLNEKKQGVHGMIAGTTGSGKSELLTTLLLGLAILHHPDRLNFMLIDFKGGATFRDLARLPHTAGFITDLSGSQAQRALIAINSELDRRKQTFGAHGVPNIKGYRNLLPPPSPIPNLLIAIDEFDEMARDYPHIVEELIRVAKQGRSLGVHLLFADTAALK
ncbi:MAG: hypothetical protein KatS3mg057_2884 [Herpetosiphonaceae bacterium]|nr:MAG: hypothetical protein KatS3mg057_2884 [Herpetosiphonaceae bacterium]